MKLHKIIATENECYKVGRALQVRGIMWHSTGANNPRLRRYVGPDDGIVGPNTGNNTWNQYRPDGRQICVHAFIGLDKNNVVRTYQTLPWNMQGWHAGGSANSTHIGFEICEGDLSDIEYFNQIYQEAVEFSAYLCKEFNLNPLADGVIICHSEGHSRGVASNHADVMHWFPKHGKNMNIVRQDIKNAMAGSIVPTPPPVSNDKTAIMGNAIATIEQMQSYIKKTNPNIAQSVLDMIPFYLSEGKTEGVRGDIAFAQSCLETGNFIFLNSAVTLNQNNFCGMGVTSNGMKGNSFATPQLGIRAQIQHLKAYASTVGLVNECIDPRFKYVERACAEYVEWLGQAENPKGKGWAAGSGYGSKILTILKSINATAIKPTPPVTPPTLPTNTAYVVKVNIPDLNIRTGPGTNYGTNGMTGIGAFTIVEESSGQGASKWGKLKSGAGWISLDYVNQGNKPSTPKKITEGSQVRVKTGAKTYTGGNVASFVYKGVYRVDQLNDARAVLDSKGICTPFNIKDLILA